MPILTHLVGMLAIFKKETSVNITLCNSTVSDIPLHFQGNTIESSSSLKLLGVIIDDQLNFNIQDRKSVV